MQTFSSIPDTENILLYTYLIIREDAHILYGFVEKTEREIFKLLISVSGVGPSTAIIMLSSMSTEEIQQAIATEDVEKIKSEFGGKFVVGHIGALDDSHKGQHQIFSLAEKMEKSHPNIIFLLVGGGRDENEFSLASFKGKLVYVDVWATWCGPCKAEIPSLQKLETDYHGKDITFMSVSVDTDKEAWEKMVADKELGGVQLWADGWSKITKDYAIFGIPRFMLFDAEGNVISTNAPRPSSEEIRELIEANL